MRKASGRGAGAAAGRVQRGEREHHDDGGQQPARVVGERDAGHARQGRGGVVERPMAGADHLGVEEEVPGGQRPGAGGPAPAGSGECLARQVGRVAEHEPGQRHQQGDVGDLQPQGVGVGVGAERKPRRHPHRLGQPAQHADGGEGRQPPDGAAHRHGVQHCGHRQRHHREQGHHAQGGVLQQWVRHLGEHADGCGAEGETSGAGRRDAATRAARMGPRQRALVGAHGVHRKEGAVSGRSRPLTGGCG